MLILSHDDVMAALSPSDCAAAMREVLVAHARGETYLPLRSAMIPPRAAGLLGLMPAWRDDGAGPGVFSLKAVCVMPGNPARGLDPHQGLVTLFDGETGVARAILDGSAVTTIRTAAVSAVATETLSRPEARVLAILGAGVQARSHIEALAAVRDFEEVRVYAPTPEHVHELLGALDGRVAGPKLAAAASGEQAVRGADVVVTVTSSREPVLHHDWLSPGTHVNAVGASQPSARELDQQTVAAAALFVDSRESLRNEAGEYRLAVEEGLIDGEAHVRAELGEVLAGMRSGRRTSEELTVFRSLGVGIEDLAAAERAVSVARERKLGIEVKL